MKPALIPLVAGFLLPAALILSSTIAKAQDYHTHLVLSADTSQSISEESLTATLETIRNVLKTERFTKALDGIQDQAIRLTVLQFDIDFQVVVDKVLTVDNLEVDFSLVQKSGDYTSLFEPLDWFVSQPQGPEMQRQLVFITDDSPLANQHRADDFVSALHRLRVSDSVSFIRIDSKYEFFNSSSYVMTRIGHIKSLGPQMGTKFGLALDNDAIYRMITSSIEFEVN